MEVAADYYATLGVDRHADDAAIRRAYRKLMRANHPDVSRADDAGLKASAINEAYTCLHDPVKRAAYDGRRHARPRTEEPAADQRSTRDFRPSWGEQHLDKIHAKSVLPRKWKMVALGLAAILTVITFTMTSSVDTTGAVPPPGVVITR